MLRQARTILLFDHALMRTGDRHDAGPGRHRPPLCLHLGKMAERHFGLGDIDLHLAVIAARLVAQHHIQNVLHQRDMRRRIFGGVDEIFCQVALFAAHGRGGSRARQPFAR